MRKRKAGNWYKKLPAAGKAAMHRANAPGYERDFLSWWDDEFPRLSIIHQAPLGKVVCDFLVPALGVIIELDGPEHDADKDARRDSYHESLGYVTVRIAGPPWFFDSDRLLILFRGRLSHLEARLPTTLVLRAQ